MTPHLVWNEKEISNDTQFHRTSLPRCGLQPHHPTSPRCQDTLFEVEEKKVLLHFFNAKQAKLD